MKSEVLSNWDMPWLPVVALLLFLGVFLLMLFNSYSSRNKNSLKEASMLPLEEGERK